MSKGIKATPEEMKEELLTDTTARQVKKAALKRGRCWLAFYNDGLRNIALQHNLRMMPHQSPKVDTPKYASKRHVRV